MCSLHRMGNESEYTNGLCHMTKLAAIPIYMVKALNNLLWNKKADDLLSWYVASGARVLPSLFK